MILLIDNYDSFTYNLYQYLCELGRRTSHVERNDQITVDAIEAMRPEKLVVSPGAVHATGRRASRWRRSSGWGRRRRFWACA